VQEASWGQELVWKKKLVGRSRMQLAQLGYGGNESALAEEKDETDMLLLSIHALS
jgi:hypothetical protein